MTTRGEINSNFYQIVNVDANGNPTSVKGQYITSGNVTYANTANIANIANIANTANIANIAKSVNVANVVGIGNIATINLSGNGSQTLLGNGTWGALPNTANANYSNFAGTAFNVSGSNVTGAVANATYATNAGSANSVNVANVVGIGNIATINKNGSNTNVLYGNGAWANIPTVSNVANANYANFAGTAFNVSGSNVSGTVANANYAAYAGNVTTASQPNITSLGTLTGLSLNGAVTGNIIPSSNVTYNLGNNTNRFKDLYLSGNSIYIGTQTITTTSSDIVFSGSISGDGNGLANIQGGNVVGYVANATHANVSDSANNVSGANVVGSVANSNYANVSGTSYSVNVANVSGIGNIATVNLDGNVSNVLSGIGTWIAIPSSANANYANFAGTAFNVSGSNVSGYVANATHANVADVANSVSAANVVGTVANANYSAYAGYATDAGNAVQANNANTALAANVASYGTVGFANLSFGNIISTNYDGSASHVLYGNGTWANIPTVSNVANANYANFAGTAYNVSGSNVSGTVANANVANYVDTDHTDGNTIYNIGLIANYTGPQKISAEWVDLKFNSNTHTLTTQNISANNITSNAFIGEGGNLSNIQVGNVVGLGNIATTNYDGNSSHVLYGNGAWANIPVVSNVANANYANFAGTAYSVDAGNIVGTVNLANYATVANSVAGANVSGQVNYAATANSVAVANVVGIGNIATTNYDGNSSHVLYGNGVWANIPVVSNVANANYANFAGTAYSVDAGNIVGTVNLANYATVANSVAGANVSGAVAYATTANSVAGANVSGQVNYAAVANSVAGANVSGAVNLANYATVANSVAGANVSGQVNYAAVANSVAVGNVSGIGNIATINLNGNSSQVLYGNGVFAGVSGGGTPGGSNTQLQYNNSGSFGGISTVTYDGSNLSLGSISNVKITGGSANYVIQTDGTGNLSFVAQSGGSTNVDFTPSFLLGGM